MPVSTDTGFSGLWNGEYATAHQLLPELVALGNAVKPLSSNYTRRIYDRGIVNELIERLAGGGVGTPAVSQHKRVKATRVLDGPSQGGLVEIETFTGINRNTTAADQAYIDRALDYTSQPVPYRADLGGNGGGGKLGY